MMAWIYKIPFVNAPCIYTSSPWYLPCHCTQYSRQYYLISMHGLDTAQPCIMIFGTTYNLSLEDWNNSFFFFYSL